MECGVKNHHLRRFGHYRCAAGDSLKMRERVKRREINTLVKIFDNICVHKHRFLEVRTAMDYSVSDGGYVIHR
ncbi:hypothetical protein SDC9_179933 [bioreactor metagenome]|uniref:Uncharacterized protein n=1 Tax=bioreactor metagenome TaxID=1076179 RepID=A0A645H088_9ZZZZ